MKGRNGCGTGDKNKAVLVRALDERENRTVVFHEEVCFLLTTPLMVDPFIYGANGHSSDHEKRR